MFIITDESKFFFYFLKSTCFNS